MTDQGQRTLSDADVQAIAAARAAGDRYSFRMDELSLFLARGFAARIDALEARNI